MHAAFRVGLLELIVWLSVPLDSVALVCLLLPWLQVEMLTFDLCYGSQPFG
jgi:hypothetical protein